MTPSIVVVMGVAGSGKSTIGAALARRLDVAFLDADDLHPAANVAKMARGEPLDDEDRAPWLAAVATAARRAAPVVVACSALKESYRRTFVGARFVWLTAPPDVLRARIAGRADHFMPSSLLESQIATLEAPRDAVDVDDAAGTSAARRDGTLVVDVARLSVDDAVASLARALA